MFKKLLGWLPILALAAASLSLSGCFQNPTNPFESAFCNDGCGLVATPTPRISLTPTPTPGTGGGSISGTVSGTGGAAVDIQAAGPGGVPLIIVSRTGDGAYTITGVPDGIYGVSADTTSAPSLSGSYAGGVVTVTGGAAVTGINITLL